MPFFKVMGKKNKVCVTRYSILKSRVITGKRKLGKENKAGAQKQMAGAPLPRTRSLCHFPWLGWGGAAATPSSAVPSHPSPGFGVAKGDKHCGGCVHLQLCQRRRQAAQVLMLPGAVFCVLCEVVI